MKRNIFLGVIVTGLLMFGGSASAQTISSADIQSQIKALLAKIMDLQAQLSAMQHTDPVAANPSDISITMPHYRVCDVLTRDLGTGLQGDDVQGLQEFLTDQGFFSGNTTGYFGPITARAVTAWQSAHGIPSAGYVGSVTRSRILAWCKNPAPPTTPPQESGCKPLTYMPVACSDGSQPKPVLDEHRCLTKYECPVVNFTPPQNCKAWNDGCNVCSRETASSPPMCTMRACMAVGATTHDGITAGGVNSIWAGKGYCTAYFDGTTTLNQPPVVTGFTGPTTLAVNAVGTWTVQAIDPENKTLSYNITWGDQPTPYAALLQLATGGDAFVQTTTFTHSYGTAGVYTVTLLVRDEAGAQAKTSMNVQVGSGTTVCTQEYNPVCGQPAEPACRHATPACMLPTPAPQTYANKCIMNAAGATFLSTGVCTGGFACTTEAKICPDGSSVGRTGANCEFAACPVTTNPVACTQEAKQCPNGTYVSRTGPNCEFAACPTVPSPAASTGGSCIGYNTTYTHGSTMGCSVKPGAGVACPLGVLFSTWMCSNGQWVSTTQTTTTSCTASGTTYAEGSVINQCLLQGAQTCNVGSAIMPQVKCANGQWVSTTQTQTSAGSCVVHRNCGDLVVPSGGVAGNSKACGLACAAPQQCVNGAFVTYGTYGTYATPHQYETSCPNDPISL